WLPWMPGSRPGMTEFSLAERIEALDQPGVGSGELLVGDAIGRHEVEGRAERPDIESVREIPVAERPALRRLVAAIRGLHIESEDRANNARARHVLARGKPESAARCRPLMRAMRSSVF